MMALHLYCDARPKEGHPYNYFPHEFGGETFGQAAKEAKAKGWVFKRDGTHVCPRCNPKSPRNLRQKGNRDAKTNSGS